MNPQAFLDRGFLETNVWPGLYSDDPIFYRENDPQMGKGVLVQVHSQGTVAKSQRLYIAMSHPDHGVQLPRSFLFLGAWAIASFLKGFGSHLFA